MSTLAIVIIVVLALLALLLVGGFAAVGRRRREQGPDLDRHISEADQALEQARAVDKGWDRGVLEAAVQRALSEQRPGFNVEKLDLVLVDDPPGVTQDRAHFVAVGGGEQVRIVLARSEAGWAAQSVS
jgi:hypothetical protein